jgi:hypothetical protein
MEIKVKLNKIVISDEGSEKIFKVRTLRTAEEIAGYVEETEKEEMVCKLEQMVIKEINNHK